MVEIYFIRHGQASFGSENYDKLSNLGIKQSKLLAVYLKSIGFNCDKIVTGTLNRQVQTSNYIMKELSFLKNLEKTPLLNEYNVRSVLSWYTKNRKLTHKESSDEKTHFILLRKAVFAWTKNNKNNGVDETWKDFQKRGLDFLKTCRNSNHKKFLVITSAGVIAMIISQILKLPSIHFVNFHMELYNSSISKLIFYEYGECLQLFNSLAHIEKLNNSKLITHV